MRAGKVYKKLWIAICGFALLTLLAANSDAKTAATVDTAAATVAGTPAASVAIDTVAGATTSDKAADKASEKVADAKAAPLPENEIPVHLESTHKSGAGDSPWMRMFGGLAIVGIMFAGATMYLRKAKAGKGKQDAATNIKMLTQFHLGPKKSLAIVRVAGESVLIGVTDSNISLIKSLSLLDEEIPTEVPGNFNSTLNSRLGNDMAIEEDFSIAGIKDVVTTRLKNLRNF